MALLSATYPTPAGVFVDQPDVSSSDTVSANDVCPDGCILWVQNGSGSSVTVTLLDPGRTKIGDPASTTAQTVPAGAVRFFRISPVHVDPATQVATVSYNSTTSVSCKLIKC